MSAKKLLLGAGALGIVASLVLWVLGGVLAEHTVSIAIAAPPERVFAYLTEPNHLVRWIGGLKKSEPLTSDGLRVGARSRETVEENGRRMEMETVVTRLEPGRLLEVQINAGMFEAKNRFELTHEAGVTRVVQTLEAQYRGAARLIAPFLKGSVQKKLDTDLARLRDVVESETGQPSR